MFNTSVYLSPGSFVRNGLTSASPRVPSCILHNNMLHVDNIDTGG